MTSPLKSILIAGCAVSILAGCSAASAGSPSSAVPSVVGKWEETKFAGHKLELNSDGRFTMGERFFGGSEPATEGHWTQKDDRVDLTIETMNGKPFAEEVKEAKEMIRSMNDSMSPKSEKDMNKFFEAYPQTMTAYLSLNASLLTMNPVGGQPLETYARSKPD